ncbi:putative mitochondrial protein [Porphyridium purpureum]|uniref:Putative mitochondrial protein n=1 Tax=Porphyridium purpureum TaxID=35688 RepID=A0A5J4YIP4_PORPP|nr:putative mitochondrial protein [Porphyridium purpureum]|eukprot:POR6223..scf297_16
MNLVRPISAQVSTSQDGKTSLTTSQKSQRVKSGKPERRMEFCLTRSQLYREAVGRLHWDTLARRPDLAYAVNKVVRFFYRRDKLAHWALAGIMRYVAESITSRFSARELNVESMVKMLAFVDTDRAGNKAVMRLATGFVTRIYGQDDRRFVIDCKSKLQRAVFDITTEAATVATN